MLTETELTLIKSRLSRDPNSTELHVFDAMWSEHCSYKSSRRWLEQLWTEGDCVIHGPGENAGVVDIGDGEKIVFKIESHNHPTFIEPFQGAGTGAGGILRDVFTMNARPIALLNSLHFGHYNSDHIVDGAVAGIGTYGNCIGVPTVSSKVYYHDCYETNPLVNAMAVGYTKDDVFTSVADRKGMVVYVGAKTGRDGIGGATMASEEFKEGEVSKRPAVQVGDPFLEKLLLEACLELFATGKVIAAQDMGAAGLTSSATEIAMKSGFGIQLNTSQVPTRESGMQSWEILLSESQERMLFVLESSEEVAAICDKWDLDYYVIGELIDEPTFIVTHDGDVTCNIPLDAFKSEHANRPLSRPAEIFHGDDVKRFVTNKFNIWEQYDSEVGGNTVCGIDRDPAIVRIPGSKKAIAMTTVSNADLCRRDPTMGAMVTVVEAWTLLRSVNAKPLAITNCMNFGSPEQQQVMHEFSRVIMSMASVCKHLDFPVVSGNVSFYNDTDGLGILPTPVIGAIGLIENYDD